MRNILVTGGVGFIGSAVARKLALHGHRVMIADLPEKIDRYANARHMSDQDRVSLLPLDVRNEAQWNSIPGKFDTVIHCASQTSARISEENPGCDVETNLLGMINLCRWVNGQEKCKIIFTSSMAIYGESSCASNETDEPAPCSTYGITKIASEYTLRNRIHHRHSWTILRLFNVYGPGQFLDNPKQGMVRALLMQAMESRVIRVTGALDRYRDFVYIDDVVNALELAVSGWDGMILNVGTGIATTVNTLIDLIRERLAMEDPHQVIQIESHAGDIHGSIANIGRISSLGWKPKTPLVEGLTAMISWARTLR